MAVFSQQEIQFADEIAVGELLQTFTTRIPVLAARPTLQSGRASDNSLQNRLYETRPGYRMPRSGGSFEIEAYLCGSQADTATGALVQTWIHKLIADGLGGSDLVQVGGLAGATATATALPSATGTRVRGAIVRVGQQGDGRALGQAAVIGDPSTSLLTGLPAAPAAGDVVRATLMAYPKDSLATSKRFLLGFADQPGMQYAFHGCALESLQIRVTHADLPIVTLTYRYTYWRELSGVTIPSAMALENCNTAISAGGSYFFNTVGTATRATEAATELDINLNMSLEPIVGQGGLAGGLQHITGWVRKKSDPRAPAGTIRMAVPWSQAKATEYDADGSHSIEKHWLGTLSAGSGTPESEGRHVAIYCPRLYMIGERPSFQPWNDLQYVSTTYAMREGPDVTSDLTRSFIRIGMS